MSRGGHVIRVDLPIRSGQTSSAQSPSVPARSGAPEEPLPEPAEIKDRGRHTIIVADDHPLILRGLQGLLSSETDFDVIESCATGQAAIDTIRRKVPDVAVVDVNMPDGNGLLVLSMVVAERLPTRVVLLAASLSDEQIFDAVSAGVHGLVLKGSAADSLVCCLREVLAGRRWLPEEITKPVFDREVARRKAGRVLLRELTSRELEIVELISEGLANKTIAERLALSEGTVKVHLHHIYQKLGIVNRASLAVLAVSYRTETA